MNNSVNHISRIRSEEQLRATLSMLCHFVWHRETRPGDHMWSIPVDQERDFDCILSDAINELVALRRLRDYVSHKSSCSFGRDVPGRGTPCDTCNCGLTALLTVQEKS